LVVPIGTVWNDPVTAYDDIDGDVTSSIVKTVDGNVITSIDTSILGSYVITYNVQDSSGNQATAVTRTVTVNDPVVSGSYGDPYIKSANGKITKLPNCHGCYRYFDYDDIVINVEIDNKDISNEMSQLITQYPHIGEMYGMNKIGEANIIEQGYFNKNIYLNSEGKRFEMNVFTKSYTFAKEYFKISRISKRAIVNNDELRGGTSDANSMLIEWVHSRYGPQSLIIDFYKNPQAQNGIEFSSDLLLCSEAKGVLVRNYKAKLMQIPTVDTISSKKINKKLKQAGKDQYHTKIIRNREKWLRVTDKSARQI
jgi:hypothetical protein